MSFNNPVIAAEAARKTLVENDRTDAHHNEMNASRADLDEQELHDLEHSLYYMALDPASAPAGSPTQAALPVAAESRRGLIARIFRHG